MKRILFSAVCLVAAVNLMAQEAGLKLVEENEQQCFDAFIPPGNYSGIAPLGNDDYAVVSDKSKRDGFFVFHIELNDTTGEILRVANRGFFGGQLPNRDAEGIAFLPEKNTILIAGEADGRILEYSREGQLTRREAEVPELLRSNSNNYGLESLTYNATTQRLWTCTENTLPADGMLATSTNGVAAIIRLQSFGNDLKPRETYFYQMDKPQASAPAWAYAMGVSELLALDDGSVLVLEREFYVPESKLGAFVANKLYQTWPRKGMETNAKKPLEKQLVLEWQTSISLFGCDLANYEGMCLGPKLRNGSQVVILVADSQDRYQGILKDWMKTIVIK